MRTYLLKTGKMADVEIIPSDSSEDTIIYTPKNTLSPQNEVSKTEIEHIVNKYISENCEIVDENDAEYSNNHFGKNSNESNTPPFKKLKKQSIHESSSSQDDSLVDSDVIKMLLEKYKIGQTVDNIEHNIFDDSNKPLISTKEKKNQEKELQKQLKNQERERKKIEKEREKSIKQALAAANRSVKPEECMKYIRVQVDTSIINEEYGKDIISSIQAAGVTYNVDSQIFPYTISWIRKSQSYLLDDDGKLELCSKEQETDEILVIMSNKEFVDHVNNKTLTTHIQSLKSVLVDKKITLAVFGLDCYIRYQNNQKQKEYKSNVGNDNPKPTKDSKFFKDFPQVCQKNIEYAMTELQLLCNCSHRLINSPTEMGLMVAQFTKSIAELPYKLQKQEKYQQTEWYASADGKDCVKVDKDGNGLQRLWNQMLTAFPLASLETAEAISSKYPTITALMKAYENCENTNTASLLLEDIPIRRAVGPVSSTRRIGPELSKKVYNFFNSSDGDNLL